MLPCCMCYFSILVQLAIIILSTTLFGLCHIVCSGVWVVVRLVATVDFVTTSWVVFHCLKTFRQFNLTSIIIEAFTPRSVSSRIHNWLRVVFQDSELPNVWSVYVTNSVIPLNISCFCNACISLIWPKKLSDMHCNIIALQVTLWSIVISLCLWWTWSIDKGTCIWAKVWSGRLWSLFIQTLRISWTGCILFNARSNTQQRAILSVSYLDLLLSIGTDTPLYEKSDNFNFNVTNCSFLVKQKFISLSRC